MEEIWGKGWSLKPEQNPADMEYIGTIIRSGYKFTYYKDRKGGIYFDSEPEDGKPEWMRRADEERRRRNRHKHCEECEYRYYSEPENIGYCQCVEGIRRKLKPGDGCSCGKRKE